MWCIGRALMIAIGVHTRYYFRGPHNIYNLPLIAFWIAFFSAFVSFFIPFIHRRLLLHIINFNLVRCAFDFISYNIDTLNYTINMYRMQCRRNFFYLLFCFSSSILRNALLVEPKRGFVPFGTPFPFRIRMNAKTISLVYSKIVNVTLQNPPSPSIPNRSNSLFCKSIRKSGQFNQL